jgi:transposase
LGVLHEARRFAGLHQLRGFCGLFPRTNSSGGADQPGQSITQSGNNRIKRALYLAADAARRIDPGLARASCFGSAQHLEPTTEAVIARRRYWLHVMPRSANALC